MTDSIIQHGPWECIETDDQDGDGFWTTGYHARHRETGEVRLLHVSRFYFSMTPERFAWLVDHGFPQPERGNWYSKELDAAMKEAA